MDAGWFSCKVPMSSPQNQKRLTKDMDLISNLPDAVLCHILTHLPTKCVVKTSTLSKRWKYLWAKVPALDFTQMTSTGNRGLSLEQMIHFKSFVDKVLLHNHAPFVERFRLNLVDCDPFNVNSWLIAVTRRKIHELNISIDLLMFARLPKKFLWSEYLVVLKLKGFIFISASISFFLPKLETIHLQYLKFPDDEFMKKLSSSCPVLRELRIVNCCGITTTLHVECLTLESLEIRDSIGALEKQHIVIKTPNLARVCLVGFQSYDIGHMNSLVEADISISSPLAADVANFSHQMLLKKVSGVKTLRLGPEAFLLERTLPYFLKLTSLSCEANRLTSELLRRALQLKSLILRHFNWDSLFEPQLAPKKLPCLERVEMCCFSGIEDEMDMVAYFLNTASNLKEMKINLDHSAIDDEIQVYQELLDLPRSSALCRIKIV